MGGAFLSACTLGRIVTHESDVIIVGAGIAGLSLSASLSRQGLQVVVLEAANSPDAPVNVDGGLSGWDRRVSALTPASSALLSAIDVWPDILNQRSASYDQMHVWDGDGTGEITFSANDVGARELGRIVENRVTVDALLKRVERDRHITLSWQDPIAAIKCPNEQAVEVVTESGKQYAAPLLVGADGVRSTVRKQLGFKVREWSYEQSAIVATIALEQTHSDTCYQVFLDSGPLALLPLAEPHVCSIVWSLDEAQLSAFESLSDADFVAALNRALNGQAPKVSAVGPRAVFPLNQCHAVDYVQPRVALIADAAHAIHPLAGQGINLGLADVAVLADEVGRAFCADLAWGELAVLNRYQRRRKSGNLAMMAMMEGFKRGFGSQHPALRVLRNMGLKWVDGTVPLKRWLAAQALS